MRSIIGAALELFVVKCVFCMNGVDVNSKAVRSLHCKETWFPVSMIELSGNGRSEHLVKCMSYQSVLYSMQGRYQYHLFGQVE